MHIATANSEVLETILTTRHSLRSNNDGRTGAGLAANSNPRVSQPQTRFFPGGVDKHGVHMESELDNEELDLNAARPEVLTIVKLQAHKSHADYQWKFSNTKTKDVSRFNEV